MEKLLGKRNLSNLSPLRAEYRAWFILYLAASFISQRANEMMMGGAIRELPAWHLSYVTNTVLAPNRYRILIPSMATFLQRFGLSVFASYRLIGILTIFVGACLFHIYLRKWFSTSGCVIGSLFLFAVLPLAYGSMIQPTDFFNLIIFILGFMSIRSKRDYWLIPVLLIGTLNRETTIFLIAVYVLDRLWEVSYTKLISNTLVFMVTWGSVYFGLRAFLGPSKYYTELVMFQRNLVNPDTYLFLLAFFNIFLIYAVARLTGKPKFLVRSLWIIPPFVAIHFVIGIITEVRLFLPLLLILVPLGLFTLFEKHIDPITQKTSSVVP